MGFHVKSIVKLGSFGKSIGGNLLRHLDLDAEEAVALLRTESCDFI